MTQISPVVPAVMVCTIMWKILIQLPVSLWLPEPAGTRSTAEVHVLNTWRKEVLQGSQQQTPQIN